MLERRPRESQPAPARSPGADAGPKALQLVQAPPAARRGRRKGSAAVRGADATAGPVKDLERHLPDDWWRRIFNATYLSTDGDMVENPENTSYEVDLVVQTTGITVDSRVLDLCCGQGRHCIELARRGHRHVTGLDRSRYLVGIARRRARAAGLAVAFHEGDARSPRLREGPFDTVTLLGNSFGYFSRAEDDGSVLASARRALRDGGRIALDVPDGAWQREHFEPRSWEWIDRTRLVCRERSLSADGSRLVCREIVVDAAKGVIADQFYAQRLYDRDALTDLLRAAGFDRVEDHAPMLGLSSRNEDLGLMEHRFFVTALVADARPHRVVAPAEDVLVLLGDPQRPDGIRPEGGFATTDDHDALRRLRAALDEVPGVAVRYHSDHASLVKTLDTRRPALVVNFCDEGFRNDLYAELHIPALLDVLGIGYTGAGPACLGLCVDKSHVRAIARGLGVPVPREVCVPPEARVEDFFSRGDWDPATELPALVKPRRGDGSVGIDRHSVVRSVSELCGQVEAVRAVRPGPVLVQEFLQGREYSIGLVGNPGDDLEALPVLEVDYGRLPTELPPILGYESKWNHPPSPYWTEVHYHEAQLVPDEREQLVAWAVRLFGELGCRDYARFDFRAGADGVPRLLEVNPNPGWGWGDEMNYMAGWAGMTYPGFLSRILDAARRRLASSR